MCGIAGHVGPTARELLPAMLGLLKHRGPDDSGIYSSDDVGLGMTRLAIIDLVTGQQPMSDPAGRYWIVFNGEIYNFRQLRTTLEAEGRTFHTRSDTEVILQSYVAWGEACVERLRGMFAFAIWDTARRRLFLARDRLGKKPLYYWHRGHLFLFASEPKALLCHPAVSRALDWPAFQHYLAFGYTPASRSIFDSIHKLPPAHTATLADGRLTPARYWRLPPAGLSPPCARSPRVASRPSRWASAAAQRPRTMSCRTHAWSPDASRPITTRRFSSPTCAPCSRRSSGRSTSHSPIPRRSRRPSWRRRPLATSRSRSRGSAVTRPSAAIRAISVCACRSFTTGFRAGCATPRAPWRAGCPTRAEAGTGATASAASPRSPTPPPASVTSAGRASSATPSW